MKLYLLISLILALVHSYSTFSVKDITFPLSTNGNQIVDSTGAHVKLACANWYGAHMQRYVVDGLDMKTLDYITNQIQDFGFNCIRLVYSLDMIYLNPVVNRTALLSNPQLIGLTALEIFDKVITALTSKNILVILNNHISKAGWCCSETDGQGLWWTDQYPQDIWFEHLSRLTLRYKNNQKVIGFDLRNQIRKTPKHTPTWGDGNNKTDWHIASTIGGNTILSINPNLLILIQGLNYATDLTPFKNTPVKLSVPNKLVYSGHIYSWSWGADWSKVNYDTFKSRLIQSQSFVRDLGIPFWMGQFGDNTQDTYWKYLIAYMKETDLDWAIWALNGYQGTPQKDESFGVFDHNWNGARYSWMINDLKTVE